MTGRSKPVRKAWRRWVLAGLASMVLCWPETAPGTVAEQRARLPPPKECTHPVEGRWKSHVYEDDRDFWHEFTLDIRETKPGSGKLTGKIFAHGWAGGPKQQEPGPCRGLLRFHVTCTAEGTYHNGEVHFWGTKWKLDKVLCGRFGTYNLDHFSGTIDPKIQEFQSLNDDRGEMINVPLVFRRIACFDDDEEEPSPALDVKPPPLFRDKRRAGGCSCAW